MISLNLAELDIKSEYRSLIDNVAKDFYIPLLKKAVSYKRAVGVFSSSALAHISKGIAGLIENGGTIKLIASPYLSDQDVAAMRKGYDLREKIIKNALLGELLEPVDEIEKSRLNFLANLIADGVLDVKIAITAQNGEYGMYHEKMGIITDTCGNKVAFAGSMNESATAMTINYEAIDVFCSWKDEHGRISAKENAFTAIWNDTEPNIAIIDFPDLKDEIIQRYKRFPIDMNIDKNEFSEDIILQQRSSQVRLGAVATIDRTL